MPERKRYLGDGAYSEFDGHDMLLTAENGIEATDRVCLEPSVLGKFLEILPDYYDIEWLKEKFNR